MIVLAVVLWALAVLAYWLVGYVVTAALVRWENGSGAGGFDDDPAMIAVSATVWPAWVGLAALFLIGFGVAKLGDRIARRLFRS